MRKLQLLIILCILMPGLSNAQFYKSLLPSPAFGDSLSTIVVDYLRNFRSIEGAPLPSMGDAEVFISNAKLPGSSEFVIYRFKSIEDTTASWQAIMYKGESYKEAAKVYKNTFRLVNKTRINSSLISSGFSGTLEEPTEDLRFTSSSLRLGTRDQAFKNFVAEVEMVNSYDGWEVHLNLHHKKPDTEKY